ncbi:MAG TPA: peptidoglycan editing factor PgeF [Woeseiaceae bacterium]|nr:peptidoglycan editing factor PgeF [Woeseiaceae bacterium]
MMTIITPEWPAPRNVVAGTTTKQVPDGALPVELQFLNQVHGDRVVPIGLVRDAKAPIDADAVYGSASGDHCAVRTADCLPILICSTDGSEIAAAHGGWRGVLAGIIENTVAALQSEPVHLLAWLGPAISQQHFEVGEEVREAFVAQDPNAGRHFASNDRGRWQADLCGLARQRLHKCGVRSIYGGHWCTYADRERFYSYRRDADTGRMVSFIHLK